MASRATRRWRPAPLPVPLPSRPSARTYSTSADFTRGDRRRSSVEEGALAHEFDEELAAAPVGGVALARQGRERVAARRAASRRRLRRAVVPGLAPTRWQNGVGIGIGGSQRSRAPSAARRRRRWPRSSWRTVASASLAARTSPIRARSACQSAATFSADRSARPTSSLEDLARQGRGAVLRREQRRGGGQRLAPAPSSRAEPAAAVELRREGAGRGRVGGEHGPGRQVPRRRRRGPRGRLAQRVDERQQRGPPARGCRDRRPARSPLSRARCRQRAASAARSDASRERAADGPPRVRVGVREAAAQADLGDQVLGGRCAERQQRPEPLAAAARATARAPSASSSSPGRQVDGEGGEPRPFGLDRPKPSQSSAAARSRPSRRARRSRRATGASQGCARQRLARRPRGRAAAPAQRPAASAGLGREVKRRAPARRPRPRARASAPAQIVVPGRIVLGPRQVLGRRQRGIDMVEEVARRGAGLGEPRHVGVVEPGLGGVELRRVGRTRRARRARPRHGGRGRPGVSPEGPSGAPCRAATLVELGVDGGEPPADLDDLGLAAADGGEPDLGPAFLDDGLDLADGALDLPQALALVRQDRDRQRAHLLGQLVAQHAQGGLAARHDEHALPERHGVADEVGDRMRLAGAGRALHDEPLGLAASRRTIATWSSLKGFGKKTSPKPGSPGVAASGLGGFAPDPVAQRGQRSGLLRPSGRRDEALRQPVDRRVRLRRRRGTARYRRAPHAASAAARRAPSPPVTTGRRRDSGASRGRPAVAAVRRRGARRRASAAARTCRAGRATARPPPRSGRDGRRTAVVERPRLSQPISS